MSVDLNHLASPETAANPVAAPAAAGSPETPLWEPKVHGESAYDRVTSMLMSMVIGAGLIVGFLYLIYFTNQAYAGKIPAKVEIVEVYGDDGTGTGGDPAGEQGASENIDTGAAAGEEASNNSAEDAGAYQAQEMQAQSNAVIDGMAEQIDADAGEGIEIGSTSGGSIASGKKTSRIGTGGIGNGTGGKGGNGVSREKRWVVVYPEGQPTEEYAKQLDSFGIELATIGTNKSIVIGSKFTSGEPLKRSMMTTTFNAQKKLYFMLYAGTTRKAADVELLRKAKIDAGNKPILQIYPKEIEEKLAQLEYAKNQWTPAQIQKTYFSVYRSGGSWDFRVDSQEPRNVPTVK